MAKGIYTTQGYYAQRVGPSPKVGIVKYNGWSKGVNVFAEHNEIRDDEFYEGVNVMLVGKGSVQLPRYGSENLVTKYGASKYNGGGIFKDPVNNVQTPILMFDGRLYKYSGGSLVEIDSSKTWDANAKIGGVMYRNQFYFGNGIDPLSKTDLNTVTKFTELSDPNNISVTLTGSGSDYIYRYAVTVVTNYGETAYYSSGDNWGPATLDASNKFTISTTRRTEPEVIGYNFYRSINGSTLMFLKFVPQPTTGDPTLVDDGTYVESNLYEAPAWNTTGGVEGKYFATFKDTLFVAGVDNYPDILFYTGTGENYESFSPDHNGGWVRIGEGDGTRITSIKGFDVYLLVIKEDSVYRFDFASNGGPSVITADAQYGSAYPHTVSKFEKDLIMVGSDNRIRTLGYEPRLLNVIRTNDISNRIQPVLDSEFNFSNPEDVIGVYYKQKYILCDGNIAVVYDRQYVGFHGTKWTNYDYAGFLVWKTGGREYLLGVKNNGEVNKLLVEGVYTDNGQNIVASFRPKTIDGGEDSMPKFFRELKLKLRSVHGSFTLEIWKDGITKSYTNTISVGGNAGISSFMWGEPKFGEIKPASSGSGINVIGVAIIITKEIYDEAYYIYPRLTVNGNNDNNFIIQTITGTYDYEDYTYYKNENVLRI